MFYGKGAGAGATASAVVGDLMQTMRLGEGIAPAFEKCNTCRDFSEFTTSHYIAFDKEYESLARNAFAEAQIIPSDNEFAFITAPISERELDIALAALSVKPLSHIRIL
jgi:hypothetical protein